jgi:hypothetical protein
MALGRMPAHQQAKRHKVVKSSQSISLRDFGNVQGNHRSALSRIWYIVKETLHRVERKLCLSVKGGTEYSVASSSIDFSQLKFP